MNVTTSTTHLVLIPCYNPGAKVVDMVRSVRQQWAPVWVVVDGSTDESTQLLLDLAAQDAGLTVLVQSTNGGKGSAVLRGISQALQQGYTHALTMDADGQHPADLVQQFMARSIAEPAAMILGKPVFDANAPALRVNGRKVSNSWANVETLTPKWPCACAGKALSPSTSMLPLNTSAPKRAGCRISNICATMFC
jgi:glycosyltransferase involved in cell wall biosynthesis